MILLVSSLLAGIIAGYFLKGRKIDVSMPMQAGDSYIFWVTTWVQN